MLFTSWLFQRIVPPVLPFALGSLGFLTNFDFANHQKVMDSVIDDGVRVNLRMRFTCTVYRAISPDKNSKAFRAVKKGDTVVTAGGIVGKVTRVEDAQVEVEIAPNVRVKVVKATLTEIVNPKPAND